MAIEITGPDLPRAPEPRDKGDVPPIRPEGKDPAGAAPGPAQGGDGVSISPLARALSVLQGMEEVRPDFMEAARALIDEQGNVLDENALRVGVSRLLEMLGD